MEGSTTCTNPSSLSPTILSYINPRNNPAFISRPPCLPPLLQREKRNTHTHSRKPKKEKRETEQMMKRSRAETMQQHQKLQEEAPTKSQRRYKSPKRPHNVSKITTEDIVNGPSTVPADAAIDSPCSASPEAYPEDPLYVLWDELSGVWPWAVEQEELSGWYPFVEGHFREIGEEEGVVLVDLWRLNDVCEVPN